MTLDLDRTLRGGGQVLDRDSAVLGHQRAGGAGGIERVENDGGLDVAHTDIAVNHILHNTAPTDVALDADSNLTGIGGIARDRNMIEPYICDTALGVAADRSAVTVAEVVIDDSHIGRAGPPR